MKLIRHIASLFLAWLVLMVSIGVPVNLHLCAGQVQSFAFFVKAQPCNETKNPCHDTGPYASKNRCCKEKTIVLKGKESVAEIKIPTGIPPLHLITVLFPALYRVIDLDSSVATRRDALYKPPRPDRDITVLAHSFLI